MGNTKKNSNSGKRKISGKNRVNGKIELFTRHIQFQYSREEVAAVRIQSLFRGYIQRKRFEAFRRIKKTRIKLIQEIIESERSYVNSLMVLEKVFMNPLKQLVADGKPVIDSKTISDLFSFISDIISVNRTLLEEIEQKMGNNTDENTHFNCMLGEVFVQMSPFFKVYTQYINNYEKSLQTYLELKAKNNCFGAFMRGCGANSETRGLDLPSFLIMPIQRPPRYVMLLSDLVENTPDTHADFFFIQNALGNMKEIANYINEKKRDSEMATKTQEVFKKLDNRVEEIALPHRRLIRDGMVTTFDGRGSKSKSVVLVFNDIIVSGSYTFFEYINVKNVLDMKNIAVKDFIYERGKEEYMQIISKESFNDLYIIFDTPQEKNLWHSDIKKAVIDLTDKSQAKKSRFRKDDNFGWKHKCFLGSFHSACFLGDEDLVRSILSIWEQSGSKIKRDIESVQQNDMRDSPQATDGVVSSNASSNPALAQQRKISKPKAQYHGIPTEAIKSFDIDGKDEDGYSGLHLACFGGHISIVKILLKYGADINIRDDSERTPLHIAVQHKQNFVISLLMQSGADLEAKDYSSRTPLYIAGVNNYISDIEYLCSEKAQPDIVDETGFSLLHTCANLGNTEAIRILLKHAKHIDPVNAHGRTPLHYAISQQHVEVVKLLLEHDASVAIADKYGHRAIHFAILTMNEEIFSLILSYGAFLDFKKPSDVAFFNKLYSDFKTIYQEKRAMFERPTKRKGK